MNRQHSLPPRTDRRACTTERWLALRLWMLGCGSLAALAGSGCGISQTQLNEAVAAGREEVAAFSNRLDQARFEAINLTNRILHLTKEMEQRDADLAVLQEDLAHQEEQVKRARQYLQAQTERFTRAIEAARGLQPEAVEPDIPEDLPEPQTLTFVAEGTGTNLVELFDLAAYPSEFFPDRHGNIQLTPALRLSLRNLTQESLRVGLFARRATSRDPFGALGVDLPAGGVVQRLRIPYDPSQDLMVRIGKQSTRYVLRPQ